MGVMELALRLRSVRVGRDRPNRGLRRLDQVLTGKVQLMNAVRALLWAALLAAAQAQACFCTIDPDISPRWLFAQFDAVVELEIGEIIAVTPDMEEARLRVLRSWLDASHQGRHLTIRYGSGLSACGSPQIYTGSIWTTILDAEHHPATQLGPCGWGRNRRVDEQRAERFDRYQREFLIRRSLTSEDWDRILQPLRKHAASWAGEGPADSCQALLDDPGPPGKCPAKLIAADGAFWAISEDWQSLEAEVYGFARNPSGQAAVWRMPLEVAMDGQLVLDADELQHRTCAWLALTADLAEVCR